MAWFFAKSLILWFSVLLQVTGYGIFLHSKNELEDLRAEEGVQGDGGNAAEDVSQDADESEDVTGSESVTGQKEEDEEDEGEQSVDTQPDEEVQQKSVEAQDQVKEEVDHNIHVMCKFGPRHKSFRLLVDSGAALSLMSEPVAKKLGLWAQLDRNVQGQVNGIGEAEVVGALHDVPMQVGDSKFNSTFYVFSVDDDIVLLGVDELSRHKCVLDLDRNLLMVGGLHGISVPFLPYKRAQDDWADQSAQASS